MAGGLRVARVGAQDDVRQSWTIVDANGLPVDAPEAFLAHLTNIERSPNTVEAYARDVCQFLRFLAQRGVAYSDANIELLGAWVASLRVPSDNVLVLNGEDVFVRKASTVTRKISAVVSFYEFAARSGRCSDRLLQVLRPAGGRTYKSFLHHAGRSTPRMAPAISLRREEPEIKVLSIDERRRLLDACDRLRDRFFLTLLGESGIRVGEALGLRHEDVDARLHCIHIRPRHNANGARVKGQRSRVVDVSSGLMRLYADYMHEEYGDLDSDYVFVNLWRGPTGRPLRRWAVDDLFARLARRTGIAAHAHMFRHTHATELLRSGVAIEVASKRLGHADVAVTSRTYSHLLPEDLRAAIDRATFSRSS